MTAMQEIVKQNGEITVQPQKQYRPGAEEDAENIYEEKKITFGQVTVSFPSQAGRDGQIEMVLPSEARLRNLTYACPLKVDVTVEDIARNADTGALSQTTPLRNCLHSLHVGQQCPC